ncbi:MAG TPA: dienelactone hydrolase family protein [Hyphomicrobiaceae bacterium]|jgi:carboxymethylenebutenolidase|nr:dienelactone hydrolase family protein [Hyphomicrobiaceae bacterium]
MPGKWIKIRSSEGGDFDCYLNVPNIGGQAPAVVLASAVHGVDADIVAITDELAAQGFIAAAPDLFWRTVAGPLSHDDGRAQQRSQPRLEKIKQGETDMADTLARLGELPEFNGNAVAMGFCYGGPYAVLGPKRLGYAAGISCHGTQMLDYLHEFEDASAPVCILWGDRDHRAPDEVLSAYRALASRKSNVELHIFPGVQHGYMMRGMPKAFDLRAREFSMTRAVAILDGFRSKDAGKALREAS